MKTFSVMLTRSALPLHHLAKWIIFWTVLAYWTVSQEQMAFQGNLYKKTGNSLIQMNHTIETELIPVY